MGQVAISPQTVFLKLTHYLTVSVGVWVFLDVLAFLAGHITIPQAATLAGFFVLFGCFLTFVWLVNVNRNSGGGEIPG